MKASVIVTTYNWPEALLLTLNSLLRQSRLPDEVIVADDGSGETTAEVIEKFADQAPFPVIHARQEDEGFRLAMSRNRAIAKAESDYIIVIDGDLILHNAFVEDHLKNARPGRYLQGGRVLLGEKITKKLFEGTFDPKRLGPLSPDLKNRKNALHSRFLSRLFLAPNTALKGIKGCNFSLYKEDILTVNGFDNRFVGWGREDSEFVARLYKAGMQRQNLKFAAVAFHLYHPENARAALPQNDRRLQRTLEGGNFRCEDGIERFLQKGER
ncbi:glycosyltransferase family 2 protein [Hydrogenimonas sp. SS33]|uniref:glycosyltransferase family 2 protein n=1 Tax=Hydrogenimonas leucolamina TaxID=2954236 RepID=UPI00336BE17F